MPSHTFRVARNVQTNLYFVGVEDPKDTKFGYKWGNTLNKASKYGLIGDNSDNALRDIKAIVKEHLNQDIVVETYKKETTFTKIS